MLVLIKKIANFVKLTKLVLRKKSTFKRIVSLTLERPPKKPEILIMSASQKIKYSQGYETEINV